MQEIQILWLIAEHFLLSGAVYRAEITEEIIDNKNMYVIYES